MPINTKSATAEGYDSQVVRWAYPAILFLMALTGFGQMPIYRRYYVSDIPGFGWLADFWTTRYVHYAGAVLLLALLAYAAVEFVGARRYRRQLTPSGIVRVALLGMITVTGVLFVVKNFSIYVFSPAFIVFLDLFHLGSVMAFLLVSLYCLVFKKRWTSLR
jgi:hypothetical protein